MLLGVGAPAHAFTGAGHRVIEAQAYLQMMKKVDGEGHRVLASLLEERVLERPRCFDRARGEGCAEDVRDEPLLMWPKLMSDKPDLVITRQVGSLGQCFHFMAKLDDESGKTNPDEDAYPLTLGWEAYRRCIITMTKLRNRIVYGDPAAARDEHVGVYELMHIVADAFSWAHVERDDAGRIVYLRVWNPLTWLATSTGYEHSPTRHDAPDERDEAYVKRELTVQGRSCGSFTDHPYTVPPECLSREAQQAVAATVALLQTLHEQRRHAQACGGGKTREACAEAQAVVARNDQLWRAFLGKHLAFRGRGQVERMGFAEALGEITNLERDLAPRAVFGGYSRLDPIPRFGSSEFQVGAFGERILQTQIPSPITPMLSAQLGLVRANADDAVTQGVKRYGVVVGSAISFTLPLSYSLSVGTSLFSWQVLVHGSASDAARPDVALRISTRLGLLDWTPELGGGKLRVRFEGPGEVSWRDGEWRWSLGLGVGYVLQAPTTSVQDENLLPFLTEAQRRRARRRREGEAPEDAPSGSAGEAGKAGKVGKAGEVGKVGEAGEAGEADAVGEADDAEEGGRIGWRPRPLWSGRPQKRYSSDRVLLGATLFVRGEEDQPLASASLSHERRYDEDLWYRRFTTSLGFATSAVISFDGERKNLGFGEALSLWIYPFQPLGIVLRPLAVQGTILNLQDPDDFTFHAGARLGAAVSLSDFDLILESPEFVWAQWRGTEAPSYLFLFPNEILGLKVGWKHSFR
ncbi:Hypothetical protein CAP_6843 [Chondromyces apiculatus DSM 436]|uniref:Uncharacterized protein n=1 Tax=Chondromyces apiculatus DSM 436 TaxID=1192034 RepID=A0A017TGS7_9BACT|nr:Hypothetical protein CAP_6843 [Chondromyces apiculatus DSM 436]